MVPESKNFLGGDKDEDGGAVEEVEVRERERVCACEPFHLRCL